MDLHLELIHAQHRVAVVLLDQLQGSGVEVTVQNTFEVQFRGRRELIKSWSCVHLLPTLPNKFYYFIFVSLD